MLRAVDVFSRYVSAPPPVSVTHYENFPVASFALPLHLRPAVLALYRFARYADDLADEGDASSGERLVALDALAGDLEAALGGSPARDEMLRDLVLIVARHRLTPALLFDLLSAFRQDVETLRYPSYAVLLDYCRRSANPIGRLLLEIYGEATPTNLAHSDAICTALQLTNFWQDIAIDWSKGRVYVPLEDLERFGATEAQIGEARCDAAWRLLIEFQTARARALLESGRPLTRALPWRFGLELSGVLAGGHRILDAIDAAAGDVFRRRPKLGSRDWLIVATQAVLPARRHLAVRATP